MGKLLREGLKWEETSFSRKVSKVIKQMGKWGISFLETSPGTALSVKVLRAVDVQVEGQPLPCLCSTLPQPRCTAQEALLTAVPRSALSCPPPTPISPVSSRHCPRCSARHLCWSRRNLVVLLSAPLLRRATTVTWWRIELMATHFRLPVNSVIKPKSSQTTRWRPVLSCVLTPGSALCSLGFAAL